MNKQKEIVLRFIATKTYIWSFFSMHGWVGAIFKVILINFPEIKFPECVHAYTYTE